MTDGAQYKSFFNSSDTVDNRYLIPAWYVHLTGEFVHARSHPFLPMLGHFIMHEIVAVVVITLLATISPGPDFAMVTRNSYRYGRRAGVMAACGIAAGVQIHVCYTMFGIGFLIAEMPQLFFMIKIAGASYLIYVGWKTFSNRVPLMVEAMTSVSMANYREKEISDGAIFRSGFLTNVLNPKTTLFVVSTFTQIVQPDTSLGIQFGYGLFMSLVHLLWFTALALFFSQPELRARILKRQWLADKLTGLVLMALGISLAFASMNK